MLMNGIVNLATTLPAAPGYIGTFDAPGIAVLVAFGVERALATAYTLVLHAALWLPITLLGFYLHDPRRAALGRLAKPRPRRNDRASVCAKRRLRIIHSHRTLP